MDIVQEKYIKAGSPNTTIEELVMLASDEIDNVRRRVGENMHTPPEVLTVLAEDEHAEVRIAVGENPMSPPAVLAKLVADRDPDVRYALAENCNTPVFYLQMLIEDENPYVSQRAQRTVRMLNPRDVTGLKPRQPGYESYSFWDIRFR